MTWLEIVGITSIAIFMLMGLAIVFMLFLQWWAEKKHLRRALTAFYISERRRKNRERRGP